MKAWMVALAVGVVPGPLLFAGYLGTGPGLQRSGVGGATEHAGQDVQAKSYTATAASGANGFAISTNGARVDFGDGSLDYASSDGTYVRFAGYVSIGADLSIIGSNGVVNNDVNNSGRLTLGDGQGTTVYAAANLDGFNTGQANVGGTLHVSTTGVGNVGGGEDNLITPFSLQASSLIATGRCIKVTAFGTAANNATGKTLKAYWGSAVVGTTAITASVASTWEATYRVCRTGVSTQDAFYSFQESGDATSLHDLEFTSPTQTETGAIDIKFTGTAGANDDIRQELLVVEYL